MSRKPVLPLLASLACATGNPLVQTLRPPQQTQVQYLVKEKLVADAHTKSEEAKDWVLNYFNTEVVGALKGTRLGELSGAELLERLDWEFKRLPLLHNGPTLTADSPLVTDDTDLETTLKNGYVQNLCQRFALGAPNQADEGAYNIHYVMTEFMGLPPYKKPHDPTLREANDCVMFLATNLRKTHCGNFMYGSVTYVVNPIYQDKFAVTAYDSGAYHGTGMPFGTLEDYYHLFQSHITTLNYNFAEVLKRWYLGAAPPNIGDFPYFEVEWMGNAWFPESMLYVIVKYSDDGAPGLFGKDLGRTLQDKMRYHGRPVIWADGDDSGMLIDGTVNMITGGRLGQEAADYFNLHWNTETPWQDFYDKAPEYLKFFFPGYDQKEICDPAEQSASNMVMGYDKLGNCVYWTWNSAPTKWECLNDGNCELSDSPNARWSTQEECWQNCGQGKWACISNVADARPGAHHCEPDSNGQCDGADTCEATCGTFPPPPSPPPPGPGPRGRCECNWWQGCPHHAVCGPCSECDCGGCSSWCWTGICIGPLPVVV